MLGYPIRTPSDHSSVDNSPRTIAASHVLHRLLMPRHPPCALQHFTTTTPTQHTTPNNNATRMPAKTSQTTKPDTTRCSHPLCNTQHTTTPTRPHRRHHTENPCVRTTEPGMEPRTTPTQVSPQDPTVCQAIRTSSGMCSTQPHPHPTDNRQHDA